MSPGLLFPKPRPHVLVKREAKAALEAQDRAERLTCHLVPADRDKAELAAEVTYERKVYA